MQHMPDPRNDDHLELALHLADHELLVEAVGACEDEKAGSARGEE